MLFPSLFLGFNYTFKQLAVILEVFEALLIWFSFFSLLTLFWIISIVISSSSLIFSFAVSKLLLSSLSSDFFFHLRYYIFICRSSIWFFFIYPSSLHMKLFYFKSLSIRIIVVLMSLLIPQLVSIVVMGLLTDFPLQFMGLICYFMSSKFLLDGDHCVIRLLTVWILLSSCK